MGPLLFFAFIVVPLLELWVVIEVGQLVGAVPTILLLLLISVAGAALVRREGLRAWGRFRRALEAGRVPTTEVVDGALLLLGGALLLTPGFLTDAVGLALLVPLTRAGLRRFVRGRVQVFGGGRPTGGRPRPAPPRDEIVDVEVIDVERNERRASRDDLEE